MNLTSESKTPSQPVKQPAPEQVKAPEAAPATAPSSPSEPEVSLKPDTSAEPRPRLTESSLLQDIMKPILEGFDFVLKSNGSFVSVLLLMLIISIGLKDLIETFGDINKLLKLAPYAGLVFWLIFNIKLFLPEERKRVSEKEQATGKKIRTRRWFQCWVVWNVVFISMITIDLFTLANHGLRDNDDVREEEVDAKLKEADRKFDVIAKYLNDRAYMEVTVKFDAHLEPVSTQLGK